MGKDTKYQCPYCEKQPTGDNRFMTHLKGTLRYGGHLLSVDSARRVISDLDQGRPPPPLEELGGQRHAARPRLPPSATMASMDAVKRGHRGALRLLQDTVAAQATLSLYQDAISAPVYLRVTDRGLTVISLDHAQCKSMIGVGPRDKKMEYLARLPPSRDYVQQATEGYIQKRDTLARESHEEQFALECINHALQNGLKLPGSPLYFVHQEWRMPTGTGGGKLDILAVDAKANELVVVELKSSRAKTYQRDKHGRDAGEQAMHYASVVHANRGELYPFLRELVQATAEVWDGPSEMKALELAPDHAPRCEVWTPESRSVVDGGGAGGKVKMNSTGGKT